MLSGLQTEINNWAESVGASNKIIMTKLTRAIFKKIRS